MVHRMSCRKGVNWLYCTIALVILLAVSGCTFRTFFGGASEDTRLQEYDTVDPVEHGVIRFGATPTRLAEARLVANALGEDGWQIELVQYDHEASLRRDWLAGRLHMATAHLDGFRFEPADTIQPLFAPDHWLNSHTRTAEERRLLLKALSRTDAIARGEAYARLQEQLFAAQPWLYGYTRPMRTLVHGRVEDWFPAFDSNDNLQDVGVLSGWPQLNIGLPLEQAPAFEPLTAWPDRWSLYVSKHVYSSLVQRTRDGSIVPDIARDWYIEDGGRSITFVLREDVFFHDGRLLTADDVCYTFQQAISGPWGTLLQPFGPDELTMEKLSEFEVRLRLAVPFPNILQYIADLGIVPAGESKQRSEVRVTHQPIGSGPYRVILNWPDRMLLVRHEKYHGGPPDQKPVGPARVPVLQFRYLFLPGERAHYWSNGELDILHDVAPAEYHLRNEADTLHTFPGTRIYFIALRDDRPPFRATAVRKAINRAADWERVLEKLIFGRDVQLLTVPVLPHAMYSVRTDVDKAKVGRLK